MHFRKTMSAAVLAVFAAVALSAAPTGATASTLPFKSVVAITQLSPANNQTVKSFSVSCAAGQRVTGGGALTLGGVHAVITEMQPIHLAGGLDSFEVTAAADQFGIPSAWNIRVTAFCATVPASVQLEIQPFTNAPNSFGTEQAPTRCSSGKYLIGTGGKIDDGGGQVDLGTFPNSGGQVAFGSAAFAKEDLDGYAGVHTTTGYSVCGVPNAVFGDFVMVRQTFGADAGASDLSGTVSCPAGMAVSGLGGGTTSPGTHLQEIAPNTSGGPATAATFVAQAAVGQTSPWQMDTEVYCVK